MDQTLEEVVVVVVVVMVEMVEEAEEEEEEEEREAKVVEITIMVARTEARTVAQIPNQDLHPTHQEALAPASVHSHLVFHRSIREEVLDQQACPAFLRR